MSWRQEADLEIALDTELEETVRRFARSNGLAFDAAIVHLICQGLECLPGGCFCGRQWSKRNAKHS